MRQSNIQIVHNKLLGGWYIVRGKHQTPIGGRFETKELAQQHRDNVRTHYQGKSGYVSDVYRFGNNEFYRNKAGRCEDAPCCGCCTI